MVGEERADGENIRSGVDFSLARDVGDAGLLPARDLSVLTNESPTGTHTIAINDGRHRRPDPARPVAITCGCSAKSMNAVDNVCSESPNATSSLRRGPPAAATPRPAPPTPAAG